MGEYAIFNICVSAAAILLTVTYAILYYVFFKKKRFAFLTPARVTCGILAVAMVLIGIQNAFIIKREVDIRNQEFCYANSVNIEEIYKSNSNGELVVSENLSVYGQYYKEDDIPGYKKFEKTSANVKYTYYIQPSYFDDTNNYTIFPNLIIFAEYIGREQIPKFEWTGTAVKWKSGEDIISEEEHLSTWESKLIMIYGRFAYNVDSMEIQLDYASNGPDIITIDVKDN